MGAGIISSAPAAAARGPTAVSPPAPATGASRQKAARAAAKPNRSPVAKKTWAKSAEAKTSTATNSGAQTPIRRSRVRAAMTLTRASKSALATAKPFSGRQARKGAR